MATLVLDTHRAILRLKEAGFEEIKAEAIVQSLQDVDLQSFATKEDIALLKADLAKLEKNLYKSGLFALLAQAALIVALIELLGS